MPHPNKIRALREAAGLSQQALADKVVPQTTQPQIDRLEKGERRLSLQWMERLALALGVRPSQLIDDAKPEGENAPTLQPQRSVFPGKGEPLEFLGEEGARRFYGKKDLPILGHVKAGAEGLFYDQGEHQGVTMRPEALYDVRNAYAVRVHDMSMYPAFEPNDIVHVNPNLAVVPDNNVVIQLKDGQCFVKRLVRRTEKHLICLEWHPEKREIRYDRSQVKYVHMIVRER